MNAKKILASTRKSLNDYVREQGNKLVPHISKTFDHSLSRAYGLPGPGFAYGLGDFLTQKITCRKAGAVIGATAPAIVAYVATKAMGGSGIDAIFASVMVTPVAIFTGPTGFGIGYLLDMEYYKRKDPQEYNRMK